jgi:hypothetical protein
MHASVVQGELHVGMWAGSLCCLSRLCIVWLVHAYACALVAWAVSPTANLPRCWQHDEQPAGLAVVSINCCACR